MITISSEDEEHNNRPWQIPITETKDTIKSRSVGLAELSNEEIIDLFQFNTEKELMYRIRRGDSVWTFLTDKHW